MYGNISGKSREFYEGQYSKDEYAKIKDEEPIIKIFIEKYHLSDKLCLEVGCGRGALQGLVSNYIGIDLSFAVKTELYKPFIQCSATDLPFKDNTFDAIWSFYVLEHIPEPENVLTEMRRVLKKNGILILGPAWQCRPWHAEGYPVRPYRDFNFRGKFIKASIPIRNSVIFRSLYVFPRRLLRLLSLIFYRKPLKFHYKKLQPNYEVFWLFDSDAINCMDPYEAILWFVSRGDTCESHNNSWFQFIVRTGELVFRMNKY